MARFPGFIGSFLSSVLPYLDFPKTLFLRGIMKHLPLHAVGLNAESSPLRCYQDGYIRFGEALEGVLRRVSEEVFSSRRDDGQSRLGFFQQWPRIAGSSSVVCGLQNSHWTQFGDQISLSSLLDVSSEEDFEILVL